MTSAITATQRPARFVDEQVAGPFALWRHEHRFVPVARLVRRRNAWLRQAHEATG